MPSRQLRQIPGAYPPPGLSQPDPTAVATAAVDPRDQRRSPLRPVLLATSICVFLLVVAAAVFALYRASRRRRSALPVPVGAADLSVAKEEEEPHPPPPEPCRFSYEQLRRATASFSPSYKLGQGGFGPVFRGTLGDGREVAVKVMDDGSLQGEKEFHNELSLAAALMSAGDASQHVVFSVGFCSDDDDDGGGLDRHWKRRRRRKKKQWGTEEEEDKWGIRKGRRPRRRWRGGAAFTDEEDLDLSCGGEEKGRRTRRLLLVYDLMHNGSLQDALLGRKCPELAAWGRRLAVALDVARGLEFLHFACEPPVVHGDIKPSNILLDVHFSAKIGDFGLARVLTPAVAIPALEDDASVNIADDLSTTAADTESTTTTALDETNSSLNTPSARMRLVNGGGHSVASAVAMEFPAEDEGEEELSTRMTEADCSSPVTMTTALTAYEAASVSELGGGCDKLSVDSGVELLTPGVRRGRRKKSGSEASGRDWWWRQDSAAAANGGKTDLGGGTTVKEYVMEWIGSEVKKEMPKGTWAETSTSNVGDGQQQVVPAGKSDHRRQQKRLEWWASLDEHRLRRKGKNKPREWWREEFCEELAKKNKKKKRSSMARSGNGNTGAATERQWWERDGDDEEEASFGRKSRRKAWSRGGKSSLGRWGDGGPSGEIGRMNRRRGSQDWASGDIPKSGGVSSTPSMRGTVCYAAPEYGGGGPLSEKCDIYSFGVLLLVLISGRRPLQVTASPMSEFERANLISWARHLAHAGKLLDLVDASLHSVDREQALLFIMVALLCLQRSPSHRPTIKEVISMLSGESDPPHLPLEFSPSPPCGLPFKSRRKARGV